MSTVRENLSDPTLLALLKVWEVERRAPLVLVDYLLDLGLEGAAEGARWASVEREKIIYGDAYSKSGTYPWESVGDNGEKHWSWWRGAGVYADGVPSEVFKCLRFYAKGESVSDGLVYLSVIDALVSFLDAYSLSLQVVTT